MERIQVTLGRLKRNGFEVFFVQSPEEAATVFFQEIWPEVRPSSVSYADSITLKKTGILDRIRQMEEVEFIETFDRSKSWNENIGQRRRALTVDLFLTGMNAVTEAGQLINLDMIGNRTSPIAFGPEYVVLTIGVNKITKDIDEAMKRVKSVSAVENAKRHGNFTLPCQTRDECVNCSSIDRICNTWSIMEKCFPKGRIKIILIDKSVGL